jgi:hypothetical protein
MPDWTVGAASTSDADADVDVDVNVDVNVRLARSRNSGSTERRALDTSLVAAFDGEFDDSSDARMREVGDGRNFTRDFAREVVCDGSVAELEAPVGDLEASSHARVPLATPLALPRKTGQDSYSAVQNRKTSSR